MNYKKIQNSCWKIQELNVEFQKLPEKNHYNIPVGKIYYKKKSCSLFFHLRKRFARILKFSEQIDVETFFFLIEKLQTNLFGGTIFNYCGRHCEKILRHLKKDSQTCLMVNSFSKILLNRGGNFCITLKIYWGVPDGIQEIRN